MLDRFGNKIHCGWTFREEAWLEAIVEMGENPEHIQQLSELTGRTVGAIRVRIYLRKLAERKAIELEDWKRRHSPLIEMARAHNEQ